MALREFGVSFLVKGIGRDHWEVTMDIAGVFEWFAQESLLAAEVATDFVQREVWLRLALMWLAAAHRDEDARSRPSMVTSAAGFSRG